MRWERRVKWVLHPPRAEWEPTSFSPFSHIVLRKRQNQARFSMLIITKHLLHPRGKGSSDKARAHLVPLSCSWRVWRPIGFDRAESPAGPADRQPRFVPLHWVFTWPGWLVFIKPLMRNSSWHQTQWREVEGKRREVENEVKCVYAAKEYLEEKNKWVYKTVSLYLILSRLNLPESINCLY